MKNVYINEEGYLESPYIKDAKIKVLISDEEAEKICTIPFNKNGKLGKNNTFYLVDLLNIDNLKDRRERECFKIVDNRSPMGYNNLTEQQKEELNTGYKAWLDVTETKIIPEKLEGLK